MAVVVAVEIAILLPRSLPGNGIVPSEDGVPAWCKENFLDCLEEKGSAVEEKLSGRELKQDSFISTGNLPSALGGSASLRRFFASRCNQTETGALNFVEACALFVKKLRIQAASKLKFNFY